MYKTVRHAFSAIAFMCMIGSVPSSFAMGDAEAGEAKVQVCAACHSSDGNSLAPTFPKIAGLGYKYTLKQLTDIQSGDRPIVEMTGQLDNSSEQDLMDMAAYYASQTMQLTGAKETQVLTNAGVEVDALALGRKIFRAGNPDSGVSACMGCHSPTGVGNAPAGYPRLGGQYAEYIEKQLRAFRAGQRVNDGEQMTMRGVARNLTDAELVAVAAYISGLN